MKIYIAPSILSADFSNMGFEVKRAEEAGADMIHCDVMDGSFVPNITFGSKMVKDIRPHTTLPLDVHLMIDEPIRYIDNYATAGADYITVHFESCSDVRGTLEKIKSTGKSAGLAIKPDTSVEVVKDFLDICDMILVMSVYPGFGGQKFISGTCDRISQVSDMIKNSQRDIRLEVDGGINVETSKLVIKSGADVLVAGSAVYGASNMKEAINLLK